MSFLLKIENITKSSKILISGEPDFSLSKDRSRTHDQKCREITVRKKVDQNSMYSSVPNRRACTIIYFGGKSPAYMTLFGPTRLLILRNFSNLSNQINIHNKEEIPS